MQRNAKKGSGASKSTSQNSNFKVISKSGVIKSPILKDMSQSGTKSTVHENLTNNQKLYQKIINSSGVKTK